MAHEIEVYSGSLEALTRQWIGLDDSERRRKAVQACQHYDAEVLWSLTESHLFTYGRKKSRTSLKTLREYKRAVEGFLEQAQKDGLNLIRPKRDWGALWVASLENRTYVGKSGQPRKYTSSWVNQHVAAARALYKALRWSGATEADPLRDVSVTPDPTPPWEKRRAYPQQNIERLMNYADLRHKVLLLLGAHAGLRISEVCRLERSHLHLNEQWIWVEESKGRKSRRVDISTSLGKYLEQYLAQLSPAQTRLFPISDTRARAMMKALCKRAGVPYRAFHALRHRATLRLKEEGLSLEDRARFLGHSNLNTTRIYSEGEGEKIREAVRRW